MSQRFTVDGEIKTVQSLQCHRNSAFSAVITSATWFQSRNTLLR